MLESRDSGAFTIASSSSLDAIMSGIKSLLKELAKACKASTARVAFAPASSIFSCSSSLSSSAE